jgi:NADH:ubiquinone oxidoreductase subunit 3 (subunit A)
VAEFAAGLDRTSGQRTAEGFWRLTDLIRFLKRIIDMEVILVPPIAFVIYLALSAILSGFGKILAGKSSTSALKTSTYASGEEQLTSHAMPGYRTFFVMALFFAILHLGVLMLGSSNLAPMAAVYLIGLILALIALILG